MKKVRKGFWSGVFFLTLSAVSVKLCGMLFKIPLVSIIGEEGMGYFNSAYVIYTLFFVLTTSGLPMGLSMLVAATDDLRKKRSYHLAAFTSFGVLGLILTILMLLFPEKLADAVGNSGAAASVRAMAPTLLFVCLSGSIRGYFQGFGDMLPTAVSQMIEAVFKTLFGILFAYLTLQQGGTPANAAAAALSGIAVGSFLSLLYLLLCLIRQDITTFMHSKLPTRKDYLNLMEVVFPVTAGSAVMSISSLIDLSLTMRRLQSIGYSSGEANILYGNYTGLAVPLFNLPAVLISPISASAIPLFVEALRKKEQKTESETVERALSLTLAVSLPSAVGLYVLAEPILKLLFEDNAAEKAAPLLKWLAPATVLVAFVTVTGAFLQAKGKRWLPILSMTVGGGVKIVLGYILIGRYGILGSPVSTLFCYLTAAGFNLLFLLKEQKISSAFFKKMPITIGATLLSGLTAGGCYRLLAPFSSGIAVLLSIAAAILVYLLPMLYFGGISIEFFKGRRKKEDVKKRTDQRKLYF